MDRPNPDELLANIKREESHRGKLKIFFGAAAGVGKTYSMLESARLQKKEGVDVIVGWVETHKRAETEVLLEGLEILPAKIIQYKNVELREFDIDAALKRKPALILVDELAHTNALGSRHPKRWQDIEELLDKGINVYTTLNVQHCESATDVVAKITGITIRETVPDTMVEKTDEIELVDLPTESLLKRLKDGKVYIEEMAERAAQHFFQPGNLIALRQLALRYTAHNVDEKLMSYKQAHALSKVFGGRDRFLVCISANPKDVHLIRSGKRIASDLGVDWTVAHVETDIQFKEKNSAKISEMMRLAEKLGAQVVMLSGRDVAETLIGYARSKNINKIIVGKPEQPRWKDFLLGSIIYRLARKCGEIDLYLLTGEKQTEVIEVTPTAMTPFSWENFYKVLSIIALCTLADWALLHYLTLVNLIMVYLLGVTWIAFKYGRRMSMIASFLSVLSFDFFFVPPYFTFGVADVEYLITFSVMFVVGFVISHLTGQLRRQTRMMEARENRMEVIYDLNRDLSKSSYPEELFKIAIRHIEDFFKCRSVVFVPDAKKMLIPLLGYREELNRSPNEYAVAQWVYENRKPAGKDTDTLPGSQGIYLPLSGMEKTVGVLGIFPIQNKQFVDPEQWHILEIFVSQTALAVEGAQLAAAALEAASKIESERFKNLLLTTYSSGLPGFLTSISKIATNLMDPENIQDSLKRNALIERLQQEIKNLNRIIAEIPEIIEFEKQDSTS